MHLKISLSEVNIEFVVEIIKLDIHFNNIIPFWLLIQQSAAVGAAFLKTNDVNSAAV